MNFAQYWIDKLGLTQHQEGGYYKEAYKSDEMYNSDSLPTRYGGDRHFATSIYFLLNKTGFSAFHRLLSDETWHFYLGVPFELFVLHESGQLTRLLLGNNPENGESLQITIPRRHWFAARLTDQTSFGLAGCTVAPGFEFDDFEMAERKKLATEFPQHSQLICELTY